MTESRVRSVPALNLGFLARFALLALVFSADKLLLNPFVEFERAHSAQGFGAVVQLIWHWGIRWLIAVAAAITVFALVRNPAQLRSITVGFRKAEFRPARMFFHLLLLAALAPLCYLLFRSDTRLLAFALLVFVTTLLAAAAVWAAATALAPVALWLRAVQSLGVLWLYSAIAAIVGTCAWQLSLMLWKPTAGLTFALVRMLLVPFLPGLRADVATRVLGTDLFAVQIDDFCSGLEGVGLMLAFCCAWLLYFRKEYAFPRSLLLIPAGLVIIFSLNVFRIAALMLMGQAGHPAAAVYGFHSQAGWITFNAAAFGLAYVSHRSAWLRQAHANPRPAPGEGTENPTAYFLLPLLTILAAGVLAQAVSSGFETLYPIRVITGAAVLWLCRRRSTGLNWEFGWRGLSAGILVFLIWDLAAYLTVPWARMPSSLAAMSPGLRAVWITSRILGSVLIVPIAEELAYRGYLMRRLMSRDFESVSLRAVRWPAVIVSAIAFGLPHGVLWWPGIVAGVVFGVLAVRTGRIGEAVLAHATTNFLIAVAVVYWDQWQLW